MKNSVYKIVEKGAHGNRINQAFDYFFMTLILLSVVSITLESIDFINQNYGVHLKIFNIISIVIFSFEYLLRIYISGLTHPSSNRVKSVFKFVFSTYGIVDLLALIPFYLPMLFIMDLRFLRILRLTRFLRFLKINRYNDSIKLITEVVKEKQPELAITGFITFLILLIASFMMYFAEGDKQPEQFPNVLATFWWAIATLTTVGYGDVYPITAGGKVISSIIAIVGIGLVALPTGIISAGFMEKINKRNRKSEEKCPHCGGEWHN